MKKYILLLLFVTQIIVDSQSQEISIKDYPKIEANSKRISEYSIDGTSLHHVDSDCGANLDITNKTFLAPNNCKGTYWLRELSSLENPYELIFDFSLTSNFTSANGSWPLQLMLGNNPSGYTWLGVDKKGKLTISYRNKKGFTDVLTVFNSDKVYFNKNNHLKFVQFPDGYFYVELNSYKRWSYDLPEASQKIPLTGLSNRIVFKSDIKIKKLEINTLDLSWGKATKKDPNCIVGDCKNGTGTFKYTNGNRYEGEWEDGEKHGFGKMFDSKGYLKYKGNYQGGIRRGYGEMYGETRLLYKGNFLLGYMHGKGTGYYNDGYYVGNWYRGDKHGYGTVYIDGKLDYKGEFDHDERTGEGTSYFTNGYYVGEHLKGTRNGYGTYYFNSGNKFVGKWKNNSKHGRGAFYDKKGKKYNSGIYENGKIKIPDIVRSKH